MGNMSAVAKVLNKQPKENSKSHKEKEAKRQAMMSKRIVCEKCGKSNVTLYNIKEHYFCKDCK